MFDNLFDNLTITFGDALTGSIEIMTTLAGVDDEELMRRALTVMSAYLSMDEDERLAIYNTRKRKVEKLTFDWEKDA